MMSRILRMTVSALLLAGGAAASHAQEGHGQMMEQDQPQMTEPSQREDGARQRWSGNDDDDDDGRGDRGWRDGRRGQDGRRAGHMRGHMMSPGMMRMMVILLDTDGDGALSLEEIQAVHARIFRAVDIDGNDRVTPQEIQQFFASMHRPPRRQ